jgi:Gamma-glutamyl cyclotransferase, AIG2-like
METQGQVRLFSYGTLQQPEVQRATFGRLLDGWPDTVFGFRLERLRVTDPDVIATSGSDEHPILRACDDPETGVEGFVFLLSHDELTAADDYEVDDYARIEVPIASGGSAWAYVSSSESGD